MADVTGYRRGTASITLRRDELERAIRQLAPAEAFTEHPHPNLWTWRDRYLPALTADRNARLVAVFLATEEVTSHEAAEVAAFREAVKINNDGASLACVALGGATATAQVFQTPDSKSARRGYSRSPGFH